MIFIWIKITVAFLAFTLALTHVYLVSQVFWRLTIFAAALFVLIIMVQLILRIISIPDLALAIVSMIMQSRVHWRHFASEIGVLEIRNQHVFRLDSWVGSLEEPLAC